MRNLLAIILGAVVMVLGSVANIALMWFSLGGKFAFVAEGPRASTAWCAGMLLGNLVATLAAGFGCRKFAHQRGSGPVLILVLISVFLGVAGAAMGKTANQSTLPAGKRVESLTFLEASEYAVSPRWFHVANVFLSPCGLWYGARLARQR